MKYGIFADIHGNLEAFEAVLEDMQVQTITHTVCLGDIVGQFANPRECLEIVRALGCPIVKGNEDKEASEGGGVRDIEQRSHSARRHIRQQLSAEQQAFLRAQPLKRQVDSFTVVHSSLEHPDRWIYVLSSVEAELSIQQQETNVCFFGHTHIPRAFIRDTKIHEFCYKKIDILSGKKYFLNVGSFGDPRDGDWRAAM